MHNGIAVSLRGNRKAHAGPSLLILLIMLAAPIAPTMAAADDYLSELEAEAEASASIPSDDSLPGGAIGAPKSAHDERKDFERVLRSERPHVYTFYSRLKEAEKKQVVLHYLETSESVAKAVNLTLDLYFKRK